MRSRGTSNRRCRRCIIELDLSRWNRGRYRRSRREGARIRMMIRLIKLLLTTGSSTSLNSWRQCRRNRVVESLEIVQLTGDGRLLVNSSRSWRWGWSRGGETRWGTNFRWSTGNRKGRWRRSRWLRIVVHDDFIFKCSMRVKSDMRRNKRRIFVTFPFFVQLVEPGDVATMDDLVGGDIQETMSVA